jgi:protocatechuate 3,4-dioxygenase beta subunit
MHDDDISSPILGRRQILRNAAALSLIGITTASLAKGSTKLARVSVDDDDEIDLGDLVDDPMLQAVCSISPSNALGPYYLNLNLQRQDITEGYPGVKTRLIYHVVHAATCAPIPNAVVDVWHCNALGVYSGFAQQSTQGQTFLRGVQYTDTNGTAMFDTIYPGWYPGRCTHVHVICRPSVSQQLTTQTFFNQGLTNRVYGRAIYQAHAGTPTTNQQDGLYNSATQMSYLGIVQGRVTLELTIGVV